MDEGPCLFQCMWLKMNTRSLSLWPALLYHRQIMKHIHTFPEAQAAQWGQQPFIWDNAWTSASSGKSVMHNFRPAWPSNYLIQRFKLMRKDHVIRNQSVQGFEVLYKENGALSLSKDKPPAVMWAVTKVHRIAGEMHKSWWSSTGKGWEMRIKEFRKKKEEILEDTLGGGD